MTISRSKDYIFTEKDGRLEFVGNFDGYYRDHADPWGQSATEEMSGYYRRARERLLAIIGQCPYHSSILEVGCGLGYVCEQIRCRFPDSQVFGLDISPVAVEKARALFPHILFSTGNIATPNLLTQSYDVIILNQLLWYILHTMDAVLDNCRVHLSSNGRLIIANGFLRNQRYGNDVMENYDGAFRYLSQCPGLKIVHSAFDNDDEEHFDASFVLTLTAN